MIDERFGSKCDIFFCYRESGSETAKSIKSYLRQHPKKHFGKVWYSDDESIGNFKLDVQKIISSATAIILFLTPDFTRGFLLPDGKINYDGYVDETGHAYTGCITVEEMIEIERQRQQRDIRIISVNINSYAMTETDLNCLSSVFAQSGILCDTSIPFYSNLNRNNYSRRETQIESFADRLTKGLIKKQVAIDENQPAPEVKKNIFSGLFQNRSSGIEVISEDSYKKIFNDFFVSGKYNKVKVFGYTGEVVNNDLITYADRYIDNIELYMLHRNPIIEQNDELIHNARLANSEIREWDKASSIIKLAKEKWKFQMKREIRYYPHQPIIKGALFCDEVGNPLSAFVNFILWVPVPQDGGSEFKSVPSDMIYISAVVQKKNRDILDRLNSQFDYEWNRGLTQTQLIELYKETEHEKSTTQT
ncbi:MAG: hypothetical protein A2Y16_00090 [Tenericutes bacterium GWF2_57_13]|nr:MAG: hypothetical protein A2Y16_00090 [Tenericutes bacterium GWF2_57_13]